MASAWLAAFAGCSEKTSSKADASKQRVDEMESGPVSLTISAEPSSVRYDRNILLSIRIEAPQNCEVKLPDLEDRLNGFRLVEFFDLEPITADGRTVQERRARLSPLVAEEHRIAPMAVMYTDRSVSPASTGGFATRPMVFDTTPPVIGKPANDINDSMSPAWICPSFRTIAAWVAGILLAVALLYGLWRLGKKIHRQVKLMRMSPKERALFELQELMEKDLPSKQLVKEFYVELTMIVRRYIERAHSVRAPEQTTEEFLSAVSSDSRFSRETVAKLRQFLQAADLVKFAAYTPESDAVTEAAGTAKEYIVTDADVAETRQNIYRPG